MSIDSILVAGGGARRLGGVDKAMLPLGHASSPLIESVIAACPGNVIVVGPQRSLAHPVTWVADEHPDGGPAAAIWSGLQHVTSEYVFVSAGDQILTTHIVNQICKAAIGHDGAWAVRADGTGQPLCAVVRSRLMLDLLEPTQGINQSPLKLMSTLALVPVKVDEGAIDDVDTWDDVRRVAKKAGIDMSQAWLDVVGAVLGVDASEVPVDDLLDLTRDVAHTVERKYAPLTTFMLGVAAAQSGRSVDELIAAVRIALEESGASE